MTVVGARALAGIPEVERGADLAALIAAVAGDLHDDDVVCVAHKVVSKAEGSVVELAGVVPGARAVSLAAEHSKDAAHVQVILDESVEILRERPGVLVCVTRHGFVCANAGVDGSNTAAGTLVLLPADPDASARVLRRRLHELTGALVAVVVTDSFGRAWRNGQVDVAIGCAGLRSLDDWRGRTDHAGRELQATWIAIADQAAAAADLARSKDARQPVVVLTGLERFVTEEDGPGAAELRRPPAEDLFRQ